MEIDRFAIFAGIGIAISVIRYGTYLWSIYKKETRPHLFSWLNWAIAAGIGAYVAFDESGGASVWVMAVVSGVSFFIAFLSVFIGEKNITQSDKIAFVGALVGIVLWQILDAPVLVVLCLIAIDALSYYPTIRKSWNDPWGEPPISYFWAGSRYFFTILAVDQPSFSNVAYPFFLMASDLGFAVYILVRRRMLRGRRENSSY